MPIVVLLVLIIAAVLEVGGDALIFAGLQKHRLLLVPLGCLTLAAYGLAVNSYNHFARAQWQFSRLIGVYVACFAVVAVCAGVLVFGDRLTPAVTIGLGLIVLGGLVIQFGDALF